MWRCAGGLGSEAQWVGTLDLIGGGACGSVGVSVGVGGICF